MVGRSSFAALAVLISLCQAGQADILYGGPLSGGESAAGGIVSCTIVNFSPAAVVISQRRIFAHTGVAVAHIFDTCNVPLGRFKSCSFGAAVEAVVLYSCRAVYSGTPLLSGVLLIAKNNEPIQQIPLQTAPSQ